MKLTWDYNVNYGELQLRKLEEGENSTSKPLGIGSNCVLLIEQHGVHELVRIEPHRSQRCYAHPKLIVELS